MDDRCTRHIVEAFDWYILPVVNPDGYDYSRIKVSKILGEDIPTVRGVMSWSKVSSLVSDSEAYNEQIGPIPSSNGSLDIALYNAHT